VKLLTGCDIILITVILAKKEEDDEQVRGVFVEVIIVQAAAGAAAAAAAAPLSVLAFAFSLPQQAINWWHTTPHIRPSQPTKWQSSFCLCSFSRNVNPGKEKMST
jgi:hypothetical protein